jgi:hypothetical protein
MAIYTKRFLSASTNGLGIVVSATSSPGDTIHTAVDSLTVYDEVFIFAVNTDSVDRELVIEWGGTTSPDDIRPITVKANEGLVLVIPGLLLQNSQVIKAYAAVTDVITIDGYVNRISD